MTFNTFLLFSTLQECESRDIPVSLDAMMLYRESCFPAVINATEGKVVKLLDSNFGLLQSGLTNFNASFKRDMASRPAVPGMIPEIYSLYLDVG